MSIIVGLRFSELAVLAADTRCGVWKKGVFDVHRNPVLIEMPEGRSLSLSYPEAKIRRIPGVGWCAGGGNCFLNWCAEEVARSAASEPAEVGRIVRETNEATIPYLERHSFRGDLNSLQAPKSRFFMIRSTAEGPAFHAFDWRGAEIVPQARSVTGFQINRPGDVDAATGDAIAAEFAADVSGRGDDPVGVLRALGRLWARTVAVSKTVSDCIEAGIIFNGVSTYFGGTIAQLAESDDETIRRGLFGEARAA